MSDQEFPIDDSARVVTFPCFILSNASGSGFVCSDLQDGSGIAVALLTDGDSLARYRQEMGLPDRGARQFNTGGELLEALEINRFRERLRAKVG